MQPLHPVMPLSVSVFNHPHLVSHSIVLQGCWRGGDSHKELGSKLGTPVLGLISAQVWNAWKVMISALIHSQWYYDWAYYFDTKDPVIQRFDTSAIPFVSKEDPKKRIDSNIGLVTLLTSRPYKLYQWLILRTFIGSYRKETHEILIPWKYDRSS